MDELLTEKEIMKIIDYARMHCLISDNQSLTGLLQFAEHVQKAQIQKRWRNIFKRLGDWQRGPDWPPSATEIREVKEDGL